MEGGASPARVPPPTWRPGNEENGIEKPSRDWRAIRESEREEEAIPSSRCSSVHPRRTREARTTGKVLVTAAGHGRILLARAGHPMATQLSGP